MRVLQFMSMRYVSVATAIAFSILVCSLVVGQQPAPAIRVTDATVGQNLEAAGMITLNAPVPRSGLKVKLTSSDPSRLLIALMPDQAGAASIEINIQAGIREPEFFLQGLDKSGTVTYTASAPGQASGTGTVTLVPSGIVVGGPYGVGKTSFLTTTGAGKLKVGIYSAMLDASMNYKGLQLVAGGRQVPATLSSSNPAAGALGASELTIPGGAHNAFTTFQPGKPGETTLKVTVPKGFATPGSFHSMTAKVITPGLGLSDELFVGQNLQSGGGVNLGEAAPAGGLEVTVSSDDPSKVVLSQSLNEVGTKTIKIKIPAGGAGAKYYVQGLTGSGPVTYRASAPGYTERTATITLAPSGVILTGPLSITRAGGSPGFVASLSAKKPTPIILYTAYQDPTTHHSADVTVQPLRAGASLPVSMKSSNPEVGIIVSPVVFKAGTDLVTTEFRPLKVGMTTLSVDTPPGYTASSNATSLKVIVTE